MEITLFGNKIRFRMEVVILCVILYLVLWGSTIFSCCRMDHGFPGTTLGYGGFPREGFTPANINNGMSAPSSLNTTIADGYSWSMPDLTVKGGQPVSAAVQAIVNREPQPIPLPEGELSMFATTPFKPECCPNTYSNSMGCACMTTGQYNYLVNRGGNNVPYSEY
jgi:hypothetical protein